jgi:glycosyltransferase involved in cell wall biosynthesis
MKLAVIGDAGSVNVQRWVEGLAHAGATVDVISMRSGRVPGACVHVITGPMRTRRLGYFAAIPRARLRVARLRPDVVIGYFATGYGTVARGVRRRPLVQIVAGNDILVSPASRLMRWIVRRNLDAADVVVALEQHMRDAVVALGIPEGRVVVLPHGIPIDEFEGDVTAGHRRGRSVVSTRSLEPFYRIDVLLRAVAALPASHCDVRVSIIGGGSAQSSLEALTRTLGISDRVDFAGTIANTDVATTLRAHDVYVSSSPSDGVSASLLEAMAAGLVPIVTDNDANRRWIENGDNGLLVRDGDVTALAAAIVRAFDDRNLAERARIRNLEIVRLRGDRARNAREFLRLCEGLRDRAVARPGTAQ